MNARILAIAAACALAACSSEEPSVADQFNRIAAETENKAAAYEAQSENMVGREERLRDLEADAAQRQAENELANALAPPENALAPAESR